MHRPLPALSAPAVVALVVLVAAVAAGGCAHRITVDPIQVEPIYVTLEITVKVDNRLNDFFAFEEEIESELYDEASDEGVDE